MSSNSREDKNLKSLDILLKDKPDDYKGRVLEYVRASGIDADDPTFILLAAQGSLDIALEKLPIEFRDIVALAIKQLRNIVALASSNTNTVLSVYSRDAESRQEEAELLEEKLNALVKKQADEIVKLTVTVEKLEQKITKFTAIEEKLEQLPSQLSEMVTEAMQEIVLANDKHDRQVVDTIVTNSTQLAGNLTETMYMHHSNSKTFPIWQVTSWKVPQWIGAIGMGLILLAAGLTLGRIGSNLDQLMAGAAINNQIANSIYKKTEQENIKLGRIEQYLGIKPTKNSSKSKSKY